MAAIKDLFIISHREDVLTWKPFFEKDSLIFAINEKGIDSLRSEGIAYVTLDDLLIQKYDPAIIFDKVRCLQQLCCLLDELLEQEHGKEINPFTCKLHALRIPFFIYAYYIDHLHFLLSTYRPANIHLSYCVGKVPLADLAQKLISELGLNTQVLSRPHLEALPCTSPDWYQTNSWMKIIAKKILGKTPYKSWLSILSGFSGIDFFFKKKPVALVHSIDWAHEQLLQELDNDFNFIFCEDLQIRPALTDGSWVQRNLEKLRTAPQLRSLKYRGICPLDFFASEITKVLQFDFSFLKQTRNKIQLLFLQFDFSFFFSSYYVTQTEIINFCFDQHQRPTHLMLHGGTAGIVKGFPYTPMSTHSREKNHTHLMVYSSEILSDCNYVKSEIPSFQTKILPVGDIYFKQAPRPPTTTRSSAALKICYIFSGTGAFNAMGKWAAQSDASLYDLRLRALELVNKLPLPEGSEFVFKSGYGFEKNDFELLKKIQESPHCRLSPSTAKLLDFAQDFDLFFIEVPSTSLLELMALNKTLVVLFDDKSMQICEGVQESLLQSVVGTFHRQEFLSQLEKALKTQTIPSLTAPNSLQFVDKFTGTGSPHDHLNLCRQLITRSTQTTEVSL